MVYEIELLDNGADDPMNAPKLKAKVDIAADSVRFSFDGFGLNDGTEWIIYVEQLNGVPRMLVAPSYYDEECEIIELDDCAIPPSVEN
jgi:hypothetical protein